MAVNRNAQIEEAVKLLDGFVPGYGFRVATEAETYSQADPTHHMDAVPAELREALTEACISAARLLTREFSKE